jgi:hypothetical protein
MLKLWRSRLRIFSDSIFVFLNPRNEKLEPSDPQFSLDGQLVPDYAAALSRLLWQGGLAHRGGIAFGKCFIDSKMNVFVGVPIVRTYNWAQRQEWFGISVEPGSMEQAKIDFRNDSFVAKLLARTKGGNVDTLAIDCTMAAMSNVREGAALSEDSALDGFLAAFSQAGDAPPRVHDRYRETARIWLHQLESAPVREQLRRYRELLALAHPKRTLARALNILVRRLIA